MKKGNLVCFLYILKCSDGSFYTGVSNNVEERLKQHNNGKASKYTRSRIPVKVIYTEQFESKGQALSREIVIKRLNRIQKEQLVGKGQ